MFDISFGELAIIFTLCLMVLGPEKLPKLASQLGRLAGQARAMARHFSAQLEQEVQHEQMMKELRESDAALSKVLEQARQNPLEAIAAASAVNNPAADKTEKSATEFVPDSDPNFDPSGGVIAATQSTDTAVNANQAFANEASVNEALSSPVSTVTKPAA
jgi:sec-independent protein translocase protein TatB